MNCAKCNKELQPVFPNTLRRVGDFPQYKDALVLEVQGGYGMYYDHLVDNIGKIIFCKACANVVIALVPELLPTEIDIFHA